MRNFKKHVWKAIPMILVLVMMMSMTAFAAEEAEYVPSMYATFWSLVPPLVAIALALITKEVYSSLFVGILVGALFYSGFSFEGTVMHIFNGGFIAVLTDSYNMGILIFSIAFVIVGLLSKIIGCSLMAKVCGFRGEDSIKIGVGMMTRGEVALIVSQKGLSVGLLTPVYFTSVILLIIISSISTPILLKYLYSRDKEEAAAE